ncbi:MAG: protein kinase [Bryobacteraceae bacterium]
MELLVDADSTGARWARSVTADIPRLSTGIELAGRFRVLRFIAAGGMGDVYEAEDLELHEHVALKTIRPEVIGDARALARFKREIQYAKRVTHPNVCRIYDLGSHRDGAMQIVFLTMEMLTGETLADRLRSHEPMTLPEALPLVNQMAEALAAAHKAGIIHRDFKSSNVILAGSGKGRKAVVTDFGLAHSSATTEDASLTETGKLVGTLTYMAPEQLTHGEVTTATDIYALGLVMYEMVTGHRPFEGETPMDSAMKRLTQPPPVPTSYVPGLNSRWEAVILRCLELKPELRFQRPADVMKALTSEAPTDTLTVGVPAGRPNRQLWVAGLAFAATCLAGAGAALWWNAHTTLPVWAVADASLRKLTNDAGLTTDGTISADGKLFAYASDRADSSNLDIWVGQVNGGGKVRITDDPADDYDPAFSPDGSQLAFRSDRQGGGIYVAPSIGGPARLLVPQGRRPRFSPDGRWLLYVTGPREINDIRGMTSDKLFVQPLPDGTATQIAAGCALFPLSPVWSPNGDRILFAGTCGDYDAAAMQKNGGTNAWVATIDGKVQKSNPELFELWRTPRVEPSIDQWIGNPPRLLIPLERGGAAFIVTVPVSVDGTAVTGPINRLTFGTGSETRASADASGRILLSAKAADEHIWSIGIDGNGKTTAPPRQVTFGATAESGPVLSRDGQKLVFSADRKLYYQDLVTGNGLREIPSAGYWAVSPAFSPDATKILFTNYPNPQSIAEDFFSMIPVSGGFAKKIWGEPGKYNGWTRDWSPDGDTLLFTGPLGNRAVIKQLDLNLLTEKVFLDDPQIRPSDAHFSNDGRWVILQGVSSSVYVAPFRKQQVPASEWIRVIDGGRGARFSHDAKLIFFISERDGFRCIWAQRLGSDMRPVGNPFAVYHAHQNRRALVNTRASGLGIGVGPSTIVFNPTELTGNVWLLEPAKRDSN